MVVDFKNGEEILCVKSDVSGTVKAGTRYVIRNILRFPDGLMLEGIIGCWYPDRFVKVYENETQSPSSEPTAG